VIDSRHPSHLLEASVAIANMTVATAFVAATITIAK
jgi:hypothetical protein